MASLPAPGPGLLPDKDLGLIRDVAYSELTSSNINGGKTMNDGGAPLPLTPPLGPTWSTNSPPDPLISVDSHEQSWGRLFGHAIPKDELPSLIEAVFSDRKAAEAVDRLRGDDVQVFIDVIYKVRRHIVYLQRIRLIHFSFDLLHSSG